MTRPVHPGYPLVYHWDHLSADVHPVDISCPYCGAETAAYVASPPPGYRAPGVSWICGCGRWSCSVSVHANVLSVVELPRP